MRRACQMMTFIKKLVHRFSLSIFGAMQRSFPRGTNFYKAFTTSIFEGFLNYRGRYVSRELPLFQMAQRIGIFLLPIYIYLQRDANLLDLFSRSIRIATRTSIGSTWDNYLTKRYLGLIHIFFICSVHSSSLFDALFGWFTLLGLCT